MKNFDERLFDDEDQFSEYQTALDGEWTSSTFKKRMHYIPASEFSEDWDKALLQREHTSAFLSQYYPD